MLFLLGATRCVAVIPPLVDVELLLIIDFGFVIGVLTYGYIFSADGVFWTAIM